MPPPHITSQQAKSTTKLTMSGMLGYIAAVKADVKKFDPMMAMQVSQAGFGMSASQQLGLSFKQNQYDKRLQALTKPADYARERKQAFEKLSETVDGAFNVALSKYIEVGMPTDPARQYALQAASNEGQIQQQVMEIEFPSGANVIEENRIVGDANVANYIGGTGAPRKRAPRRAAPRKKRAPRRKR